jgi:hypothetical protein
MILELTTQLMPILQFKADDIECRRAPPREDRKMAAETHVKTYRVAVPGDEPAILNIFAEVAPEVPTAVRPQTEGIIKELVATGDSWVSINADDKIVGYALAAMDTNTLSLVYLGVSKTARNQRVSSSLKNPGRCDAIGCFDSFGAQNPIVPPNKTAINTQYGACPKTQQLQKQMASADLSPVWENYCLKSTQVDYTAADGTPYVLGNSVIEGIVGNGTVAASSCIACHSYASYGATGAPTAAARAILPFNPTGNPIPGVLANSKTFAFMWGVLQAK